MSEQCTQSTRFSYNQHVMSDDKPRMLFGSPSARHIQGGGGGGKGLLLCTIGLRCPLLHPTLSIPLRKLVRRVVERTSDKLGRSKSLGSKSQHFPKPQHTSSNVTTKRFSSQGRKGKGPQTAGTGDLGGTFITRPSYASCALDLRMF